MLSEVELEEPLPDPEMGQRFQMVRELVTESGAVPRWPGPPEEDAGTRGVLVVQPVQADDRSGGARASMHPSPSMTAMGGPDDAAAPSARVVPSARCNGSAREPLCRATVHECGQLPLGPPRRKPPTSPSRWPASQPGRGGNQIAVLAQSPNGGQAGKGVHPR
jgi:hypothetical protein